jgi:hypothetical protein
VKSRRTLLVAGVATVVVVVLLVLASRLIYVHNNYGVFAWSPSAPTPKLPFASHSYVEGGMTATANGTTQIGTTSDGFPIYGPSGSTPSELLVRLGPSKFVVYSLSGSP